MIFPGHNHDAETDFFENWNRCHDPSSGRYLQSEPNQRSPRFATITARQGFGAPSYAYALNNPVNYVDPDGLEVRLMDEPARRIAATLQQNPLGRQPYQWLDTSPDTYEVWERENLGPMSTEDLAQANCRGPR
ncbi:RHS repeat-associated core domain-containing protein [Myxococcus stipitatus]|uniref:RHS repeat-associated core domain-containing protein n=1 Tax=Myxococcus stipitatus TaxID=83455 RepID=UPI0009FD60E5